MLKDSLYLVNQSNLLNKHIIKIKEVFYLAKYCLKHQIFALKNGLAELSKETDIIAKLYSCYRSSKSLPADSR